MQKIAAFVSGLAVWIKPALHLLSIPGYLEDGRAWGEIWYSILSSMAILDWSLLIIGVPCFWYAFQIHTWLGRIWSRLHPQKTQVQVSTNPGSNESTLKSEPSPKPELNPRQILNQLVPLLNQTAFNYPPVDPRAPRGFSGPIPPRQNPTVRKLSMRFDSLEIPHPGLDASFARWKLFSKMFLPAAEDGDIDAAKGILEEMNIHYPESKR